MKVKNREQQKVVPADAAASGPLALRGAAMGLTRNGLNRSSM